MFNRWLVRFAFPFFALIALQACTYETVEEGDDMAGRNQSSQGSGGIGATVDMTPGNSAIKGLLNMPGGVKGAETFTVQFAMNLALGAPTPRCVAFLSWVINGNQVTREIDVGNGVSISGSGTGLQVQVQDQSSGIYNVNPQTPYSVTALLTPGVRASQSQLPTLQAGTVNAINVGSFAVFPIPPNAGVRAALVTATPPVGFGALKSTVIANASNATTQFTTWDPSVVTGFVPIPPGATQVVVYNIDATYAALVSCTWGIDG